jgi:LysR family glycine cleavage system transcriptional activator
MMKNLHLTNTNARQSSTTPSLSALQAFERAAAHLSFLLAARDLGLTPSAVSHRIRGLEQKFGVRLFARAGRAIKLTSAGQHYLQTVKTSLDALEQGSRDLEARGAGVAEIRLSAPPFFTSAVIIPALGDFRMRFPNVMLRVDATTQYADFDRTRVDAAVRYGRERSAGLHFEPLVKIGIVPVCAPEIARRLRSLPDLAAQPLIHLTIQPAAWPNWLKEAGLDNSSSRSDLWFDNVLSLLDAAERGFGITLAMYPLITARKGFGRSLVIPFNCQATARDQFYLVHRSEHTRSKRMVMLRRWLTDAINCANPR